VDVQEMISRTQDAATVKRVYGDPYEKDGVTIVPAARVSARGGSGGARGGEHSGGGYRVDAEPVGAYVIRDGEVEWQPAFDLNGVIRRGQLVGMAALLVLWAVLKTLRGR
jgi:uncharacterized spore protein YtfJ